MSLQAYPIPAGKTSAATCSTAAMAWPELYPGAGEPLIWILLNRLKRLVYSGPETRFTVTMEASGLIQLVKSLRKLLNGSRRPILQHKAEAAGCTETRNGGRSEGKSNSFRNFRAHFLVQSLHQTICGELETLSFVPRIELKEIETGVAGRSIGQEAKADDRVVSLNPVSVRQNVIHFAHDGVGALQRSSIRKLELNERISLIFFRNEATRKALAHRHRDNRNAQEQEQRNSPSPNETEAPAT